MRIRLSSGLLALALLTTACGSDSPTAPTNSTGSQVLNVSGVWTGTSTLTNASGGECVGPSLQLGNAAAISVAITQTGANLTATLTSTVAGTKCTYTGTAGSSALTLNASQCDIAILTGFRCTNGTLRDMRLSSQSLTLSGSGNRLTGALGELWNVTTAGTTTAVGILTDTSSVVITK